MEAQWLFLTREESLRAIYYDLFDYDPQPELLDDVEHLLRSKKNQFTKKKSAVKKGIQKNRSFGVDKVRSIWKKLQTNSYSMETLAVIMSRVFWAKTCIGRSFEAERAGVWIAADMSGHECLMCGGCCRNLSINTSCTDEDYGFWVKKGRNDILEWVGIVRTGDNDDARQLWVYPGTEIMTDECPWLKKSSEKGRYFCNIHDVKPEVCRDYPGSRKHAVMTGCPGVK